MTGRQIARTTWPRNVRSQSLRAIQMDLRLGCMCSADLERAATYVATVLGAGIAERTRCDPAELEVGTQIGHAWIAICGCNSRNEVGHSAVDFVLRRCNQRLGIGQVAARRIGHETENRP